MVKSGNRKGVFQIIIVVLGQCRRIKDSGEVSFATQEQVTSRNGCFPVNLSDEVSPARTSQMTPRHKR